ncbi:hypothetical protein M378DRAFT_28794 [Amanita muscaria Koide BX008]|uniref:Uncharacterized protein n=1 Tax=Amanita muscaria (strain Koide BX008) TaxID=946122 RepID=A0A0C2WC90_AMAMK|nr:hypothetical protein M378DRAFT_28794 [Amanita muscaria Koide BX008]
MHPFIVAAFSLLICTVYASPVYRDDTIEILKREPEVWHGFVARGIKELFQSGHKCHVTKGSVKDTLGHLTNQTDGYSSTIKHYDIAGGYGGLPAVLKRFSMPKTGKSGKQAAEKFVKNQVEHLCQVNQFLNWGVDRGEGKEGDTYYVVTRKMGMPARKTGLNDDSIKKLQKEAITRYHNDYHVDIQNLRSSNFVYRTLNGNWNAEVIDTSMAKLDKGAKLPEAPEPQSIS